MKVKIVAACLSSDVAQHGFSAGTGALEGGGVKAVFC